MFISLAAVGVTQSLSYLNCADERLEFRPMRVRKDTNTLLPLQGEGRDGDGYHLLLQNPIPLLASALKGEEVCSPPLKGRGLRSFLTRNGITRRINRNTSWRRERGISLVELIMFILIVSVALVGVLLVMNTVSKGSADPLIRKQSLAIAESLLEEVELMPFTFCDPDDASAVTATSAVVGVGGCATTKEVIGIEGSEGRYTPPVGLATSAFDNVSDYHNFPIPAGSIAEITDPTPISLLVKYAATISVAESGIPLVGAASAIPATEALGITVTVTGPDKIPVVLTGYRTRYAPRAIP